MQVNRKRKDTAATYTSFSGTESTNSFFKKTLRSLVLLRLASELEKYSFDVTKVSDLYTSRIIFDSRDCPNIAPLSIRQQAQSAQIFRWLSHSGQIRQFADFSVSVFIRLRYGNALKRTKFTKRQLKGFFALSTYILSLF